MEEACADIESIRRQLAALRSQDATLSGPPTPSATPNRKVFEYADGGAAQEKKSKEHCQLEAGLEEAKVLTSFTVVIPNFIRWILEWCNTDLFIILNHKKFVLVVPDCTPF